MYDTVERFPAALTQVAAGQHDHFGCRARLICAFPGEPGVDLLTADRTHLQAAQTGLKQHILAGGPFVVRLVCRMLQDRTAINQQPGRSHTSQTEAVAASGGDHQPRLQVNQVVLARPITAIPILEGGGQFARVAYRKPSRTAVDACLQHLHVRQRARQVHARRTLGAPAQRRRVHKRGGTRLGPLVARHCINLDQLPALGVARQPSRSPDSRPTRLPASSPRWSKQTRVPQPPACHRSAPAGALKEIILFFVTISRAVASATFKPGAPSQRTAPAQPLKRPVQRPTIPEPAGGHP